MPDRAKDEQYSDKESERRATAALRRALTTPYTPQSKLVGKVGRNAPKKRVKTSTPKSR